MRKHSATGFTLIEILIVLALVAVLAGIVSGNLAGFIDGARVEPPERVLKRAVLDGIYFSNERKKEVWLSYFEENASFLVTDPFGDILGVHKIYDDFTDEIRSDPENIPKIYFDAIGPSLGVSGENTNFDDEQLRLSFVRFHAGSSTPFTAEIIFREKVGKFRFDPFSGYEINPDELNL